MALSKLKMNQVDREKLYFNKYSFRGILKTKHLYYAHSTESLYQYRKAIKHAKEHSYSWRGQVKEDEIDYDLIEKIILFKMTHKTDEITFRHESDKLAVFTNDPKVLEEIVNLQADAELTQILLSPAGTKYFKIDPPAKYRIYLRAKKIDEGTRDLMCDFFKRDLVKPCGALVRNLSAGNAWRWQWTSQSHFIDYDEETSLSYMGLMFPEILGKTYKLEKKQD